MFSVLGHNIVFGVGIDVSKIEEAEDEHTELSTETVIGFTPNSVREDDDE